MSTVYIKKRLTPIGLRPHHLWLHERIIEINTAMARYLKANEVIPDEWILEKRKIEGYLNKHYPNE